MTRTARVLLKTKTLALAAGFALVSASSPVAADAGCPARVEFLRRTLHREASHAQTWSRVWMGGLAAATVGQLVAVPFVDDDDRVDFYVGSASSLVGVAALLAAPLRVVEDSSRFERLAAHGDEPCLIAARGERMLERSASDEQAGVSALKHVGNVAFNLGIGLILGLGFGHWESAAINVGAGVVIGETLLLTQPTGLTEALARYRAGDFAALSERRIAWTPAFQGFSVTFKF